MASQSPSTPYNDLTSMRERIAELKKNSAMRHQHGTPSSSTVPLSGAANASLGSRATSSPSTAAVAVNLETMWSNAVNMTNITSGAGTGGHISSKNASSTQAFAMQVKQLDMNIGPDHIKSARGESVFRKYNTFGLFREAMLREMQGKERNHTQERQPASTVDTMEPLSRNTEPAEIVTPLADFVRVTRSTIEFSAQMPKIKEERNESIPATVPKQTQEAISAQPIQDPSGIAIAVLMGTIVRKRVSSRKANDLKRQIVDVQRLLKELEDTMQKQSQKAESTVYDDELHEQLKRELKMKKEKYVNLIANGERADISQSLNGTAVLRETRRMSIDPHAIPLASKLVLNATAVDSTPLSSVHVQQKQQRRMTISGPNICRDPDQFKENAACNNQICETTPLAHSAKPAKEEEVEEVEDEELRQQDQEESDIMSSSLSLVSTDSAKESGTSKKTYLRRKSISYAPSKNSDWSHVQSRTVTKLDPQYIPSGAQTPVARDSRRASIEPAVSQVKAARPAPTTTTRRMASTQKQSASENAASHDSMGINGSLRRLTLSGAPLSSGQETAVTKPPASSNSRRMSMMSESSMGPPVSSRLSSANVGVPSAASASSQQRATSRLRPPTVFH